MGARKYDFAGWATKNDIRCSDGRVIRRNAFAHCDGKTVPLVWNHGHNSPENVLGYALLRNKPQGVYAYGFFNDSELATSAKTAVQHGDITALSIYANHLKQNGPEVLHGAIREVSLVLAGANDGAVIDDVIAHSADDEPGFILYNDAELSDLTLEHSRKRPYDDDEDDEDEDDEDEDDTDDADDEDEDDEDDDSDSDDDDEEDDEMTPYERRRLRHADDEDYDDDEEDEDGGETVADVFDTLTAKQKKAVYGVIGAALEDNGGDSDMKHNVFDSDYEDNYLVHADVDAIMEDAKRIGSMREAVLAHADDLGVDADELVHADTYGVYGVDTLFPDAKLVGNNPPEFIKREMDWVPKVLNGTHHTPFSRIKSQYANITEDEARARGYIKGKLKKEEVFSLLKRTTDPCTIYKKQKMDRDDIVDITDFEVVTWIKGEMRMMLDEEIARAILIGDGRLKSDEDHIPEDHVRPIWKESDLFAVKATITMPQNSTDDDRVKAFIRACIKSRKLYKGSGSPTMFTTEDLISDALLLEDGIGHMLYESEAQLATKCRVSSMVPVPVMEGASDPTMGDLAAIIVNLKDYNVGADKGGSINMFDDFDIDYNQYKYLIETRCSGALIKPYSAIVISFKTGDASVKNPIITFSGNGLAEYKVEPKE